MKGMGAMTDGTARPQSNTSHGIMCDGEPGQCPNTGVARMRRKHQEYLDTAAFKEGHKKKGSAAKHGER